MIMNTENLKEYETFKSQAKKKYLYFNSVSVYVFAPLRMHLHADTH